MSNLAYLGGKPVTKNILGNGKLISRPDLERRFLLEAYDSGVWDDQANVKSMVAKFQAEWARFSGSRFCALLTNGTHTLQLALESLDIGFGDEVIVSGLTWQATASVICDVNAVPVLVDVDPETMCIDPKKVEAAITSKTRAVMITHLYNRMADMDKLLPLAKKYKLHVIEDCAHAHGSKWDNRGAGTMGDFGSFSFQRSKLLTGGEGGALLMQKEDLYSKVISQRNCGREYNGVKVHNGNYRITSFQAAVLRGQLAAFRRNAPVINRNSLALDKAVADAPGVKPLRRSPHITRHCGGFAFVFLYDKNFFDGLDGAIFRVALAAELERGFRTTYTPLNHSEVYYPQTKRRHHLSKSYVRAITPSRWKLPVCESLWRDQAVVSPWVIFACPPSRAGLLTDAIVKIFENRADLLKLSKQKK